MPSLGVQKRKLSILQVTSGDKGNPGSTPTPLYARDRCMRRPVYILCSPEMVLQRSAEVERVVAFLEAQADECALACNHVGVMLC